jgi:ribosome-associated translation inhibitor RaiA
MKQTLQTTFRNVDRSEAVESRVREEAEKLHRYFDRIQSCRVMVEAPHRHHLRGEPFHIRIEVGVPGRELVVGHDPSQRSQSGGQERRRKTQELTGAHRDVYIAIRDAFRAMRRQLQDYVHCLRHEVKTHAGSAA